MNFEKNNFEKKINFEKNENDLKKYLHNISDMNFEKNDFEKINFEKNNFKKMI